MKKIKNRGRVLIVLNTTWNLANFRSGLIRGLVSAGYEVIAVAPPDKHIARVVALGCRYLPLSMDNQGKNPIKDLWLFLHFWHLFRRVRPSVYLGYTIKPNVYGSLAARILHIPTVNNIAGLGAVFNTNSWLTRLVRLLYTFALARSRRVFFQNEEDRQLFVLGGVVSELISERLPGSGIDLKEFLPAPLPNRSPTRFLMIARMLWDKGVGEFVEAARLLRKSGLNAEFCLLGFLDVQNPSAISRSQMEAWVAEGVVRYLGVSDNVREEIAQADCVVLPSFYREGTPRTLLEAAAMARPIITTDSVGCRDVVDDGVNGFLCRPKDAFDLAEKMHQMFTMSPSVREAMGLRGRKKVEADFDEEIVIRKYLQAIELAISSNSEVTATL